MPIICVEGPKAVGKTTVCLELQDLYGAYIISDTSFNQEEDIWAQCARQIERWQLAVEKSKEFAVVVLDGDVFSPLVHLSSVQRSENNAKTIIPFQQAFMDKEIGFPDHYFYLQASALTLKKRRLTQRERHRSSKVPDDTNYRRYYEDVSKLLAGTFHTMHAFHEQKTARQVMRSLSIKPRQRYNRETFQHMRTLLLQGNVTVD